MRALQPYCIARPRTVLRILAATYTGNIDPERQVPVRRKQSVLHWPERPQEHKAANRSHRGATKARHNARPYVDLAMYPSFGPFVIYVVGCSVHSKPARFGLLAIIVNVFKHF